MIAACIALCASMCTRVRSGVAACCRPAPEHVRILARVQRRLGRPQVLRHGADVMQDFRDDSGRLFLLIPLARISIPAGTGCFFCFEIKQTSRNSGREVLRGS
mmetsp:Transcript_111589/g.280737  ORF Transcript_111589/g.280737 Transcript_111589/m.280737 type:complete len:103 (+) Transcript_111589:2490-2798(+)